MELVSLNTIIYDILNIIRGAQVSDDEPISERQIESWIHEYRAFFLKRDIDKGRLPNPDYIQSINPVALEYDEGIERYRTSIDIPNTIDFNNQIGITFVGDIKGNQIQLLPEKRVNYQQYTKWTQDDTLAYLSSNRVYLYNPKGLSNISIRGIFENPVEAFEAAGLDFDYDTPYPLPATLVPLIKESILQKELNIEWQAPNDNVNNADHDLSQD